MSWEAVPWMVDGGVHSAEVARLLAFVATSGGEGVATPSDCKVVASAIPDGNVHINSGALGILNRFPGGGSQSYLLRNVGDEVKAMTPQGSSGVRYDLVCVIVEDPQYPGQPAPPSVPNGPYLRTVVYENVPSTTTKLGEVDADQSGYALARVKFDVSDGTVNQADITDLRRLLLPRNQRILRVQALPDNVSLTSGVYVNWPPVSQSVEVPDWATHAVVVASISGAVCFGPYNDGYVKFQFGGINSSEIGYDLDIEAGGAERHHFIIPGEITIPPEMRGTTQNIVPMGYRIPPRTGFFNTWYKASMVWDIEFVERPM